MTSPTLPKPAEAGASEREESRYLWPPLLLSIVLLWFVPMFTGLGRDESGNWWVIKDGFGTMLERVRFWPTSVLFNSVAIMARSLGGDSDIVLRIPALLAALGAIYLLYRLGLKLIGPLGAMLACLVFVTMRDVVQEASVLRQYSLAILLVIGAVLALVNWLDSGRSRYGIAYAILSSLTLYATFLFGTMFLVHAAYAIARLRERDCPLRPSALLCAWFASGLLSAPLVPLIRSSFQSRGQLMFLSVPPFETALASVIPFLAIAAAGAAILLALIFRRRVSLSSTELSPGSWLIAIWALTPPAIILGLALFTDIQLFTGRYFLSNAPAVALAAGMFLSKLSPASVQRLIAAAIAVTALLVYGVNEHFMRGLYDFRGAVAGLQEHVHDPQTPVILVTGMVQGASLANVLDPKYAEVLASYVLRYKPPGRLILAPFSLTDEAKDYMDHLVSTTLQGNREFYLIGIFSTDLYHAWLEGRCLPLGFTDHLVGNYGGVEVYEFERRPAH